MKYEILQVTSFQQNCSIVWCERTQQGAIIDPGGDVHKIIDRVQALGIHITQVLLTHGHLDHVGGAKAVADHFGVEIIGPQDEDAFWLDNLPAQCQSFGFPFTPVFHPNQWLSDGDTVCFGEVTFQVIHCPGHTPGHIVFYHQESKTAFVGDVIFKRSVGRSDFPKGDGAALIRSIKLKLFPLGDDVTFIPGHGACSTFGYERMNNPFLV